MCGHRGAPAVAPENTVDGFVAAANRGATWIEFDVRPTRDGVLVIHHDPVTSGGVPIAGARRTDLDPSIPSFAELANLEPELGLDIEMKTDDISLPLRAFAELVIADIEQHVPAPTEVMVTSFDAAALAIVHELRPDLATGLLFHEPPAHEAIARAVDVGHVAVAPWVRLLDADLVERARGAGLGVITWTVNRPEDIVAAAALGVDMIIGDDPQLIADHLGATG